MLNFCFSKNVMFGNRLLDKTYVIHLLSIYVVILTLTLVVFKILYKRATKVLFTVCLLFCHGDLAAFGKCSPEGQVFRGKISDCASSLILGLLREQNVSG